MRINIGFIVSRIVSFIHRPATRDCKLAKSVSLASGSYCVGTEIGRYSYLGKNTIIVNAKIGSFCSIASYCSIGGGSHPTNFFSTSPVFYEGSNTFKKHFSKAYFVEAKPVIIGNDVWIGEKVFIKDGITIGNGAIIGAHSVVTHDIPPYAIVGGVPARIIRYRFSEEVIKQLETIKWWELNEKELIQFASSLECKEVTIESLSIISKAIK